MATEALLPWLLNDTLTPDERRELETHLQSCTSCRDELGRQRRLVALYSSIPAPAIGADSDAAFARVMARLQTDAVRAGEPRSTSRPRAVAHGWRIAFAVQMGVILVLGATLGWTLSRTQFTAPTVENALGTYRGLAAPSASESGDAIVVFDPNASEADLRRVLQQAGARIVDGPTARNAYVVRFAGRDVGSAIATLRAEGAVLRVESLSAAER
jgi:hypothetical protein